MRVILASKSPRRRELLSLVGLTDFEIIPATEEREPSETLPPGKSLENVALLKALNVQSQVKDADAVIIAADTMVALDGWLLGKPDGRAQAREMLAALSGRRHTVYTGLAVIRGDRRAVSFEATEVYFRTLRAYEITSYLDRENVLDKAGAYAIQGLASAFIERIEGDYFNVVGLPLCRLGALLGEVGLDIFS